MPDLCKPCREKKKAEWMETTCKSCGATIRYHVDWERVPNLCKTCREEQRAARTQRAGA